MSELEAKSKSAASDHPLAPWSFPWARHDAPTFPSHLIPFAVTSITVVLAGALGWAMWEIYMATPWTRDATVRAYVATIAPEVSGRIVELRVSDNQFVHKGDLLMVVDPTDYKIAVSLAEASS